MKMQYISLALVAVVLMGQGCSFDLGVGEDMTPPPPAPVVVTTPTPPVEEPEEPEERAATTDARIAVTSPVANAKVTSPLAITGTARGTWYFEASFPVKLEDAGGKVLAQGPASAQGEWMTEEFVPFTATLTFSAQPKGSEGWLVLEKDNPSGLSQNDAEVRIPVMF